MEDKGLLIIALVSIVAIAGMVILSVNGSISGYVPKTVYPIEIALISPQDGATGVTLTPTLDWTRTHRADFIILYLDDESGFSSPIIQEFQLRKNERAFTVPEGTLQPGTKYYWRVVAYNENGATNSKTFSFTTG